MTTKTSIVQRSLRQLAKTPDLSQDDAPSRASLGRAFWSSAVTVWPSRNRKLATLGLDPEILDWFGVRRDDPHTGINAVLRRYVEARKSDR